MATLERRDPQQRDSAILAVFSTLVARAQGSEGWKQILEDVRAGDIDSRAALAQLPVTRKSELKDLQTARQPFGGLNTTPHRQLRRLFVSPGPIFDPEGQQQDWWRFARPMRALGLHAGHIIQN